MLSIPIDTAEALKYFKKSDNIMYSLLYTSLNAQSPIAVPKTKPVEEYFATILTSIISQQISTKAADAVRGRVLNFLGEFTPEKVIKADFETLKACGLSGQKTKYIKHNAEVWHTVPIGDFASMTDTEVIAELTKLYGIGKWTAEMFLMFSLARPDIFSYGDLGLMNALYRQYNFKPHYVRKVREAVDSWSPHSTAASLALWHTIDNGPVLL